MCIIRVHAYVHKAGKRIVDQFQCICMYSTQFVAPLSYLCSSLLAIRPSVHSTDGRTD